MKFEYFLIGMAILAAFMWGYNIGTLDPRIYTYDDQAALQICGFSRTVNSGEWEEACGAALNAAGGTLECESQHKAAKCWIKRS